MNPTTEGRNLLAGDSAVPADGPRPASPARRLLPSAFLRGAGCHVALGALCGFFAFSPVARAADSVPAAPVAPGIVELPKFEVTDSRLLPPPERWRYAEVPGFEIISQLSERNTKRFVDDFMLLQEVIEVLVPGLARGSSPVPTALILCGGSSKFEQFLPADNTVERYGTNAQFYRTPERAAIVVDFALQELRLTDGTSQEADPYRAFYKAYFTFLIRRQLGSTPVPAWFEEGLVQIFAATEFDRKTITFAQIGDGWGGEKTGDFNHMLNERALIPLRTLLEAEPQRRDAFWSAQCYGFVHLCLYGRNLRYQKSFIRYLQRLGQEPPTEELFKECFNQSYNDMGMELRGYVGFTDYKKQEFRAKKGQSLPAPPKVELVDAPDHVVGRLKGEVMRLAGNDDARNTLIAPYIRGERDPRLLAALGLDEAFTGHEDRARKFLEAAADARVDRARAYLELGRLRLAAAREKPAAPDGKFDPKQMESVLTPLFAARSKAPRMADVYALIAETWQQSATPPQLEHFEIVLEGVRYFPRDANLVLQATLLAAGRGFEAQARGLAKLGVRIAKTDRDRERFETVLAAFARDEKPLPPEIPAVPMKPNLPNLP